MGRMIGGWCKQVLVLAVLGIAGGGCAWYEGVVEQQDLRLSAPPPRQSARVYTPEPVASHSVAQQPVEAKAPAQDVAALRVELHALQDGNRRLLAQVGELEDTLAARNKQVEELRKQVAELETRLRASDDEWQRRQADLGAQHKQALDAMAEKMAQEMAETLNAQQQARKTAVAGVHTVGKGEVLGVIAAAYRVSLKDLMAINGLKNDTIRVGQQLKIPAPSN